MSGHASVVVKVAIQVGLLLLSYGLVFLTVRLGVALTAAEQIVTTVVFFTAGLVIELLVVAGDVAIHNAAAVRFWEALSPGDQQLGNIRALYARLVERRYSDSDLYINYFRRQFAELERVMRDAVEKNELWVRSHHFESADDVLSAFSGEDNPAHCYTWILTPGEPLFDDEPSIRYFQLVEEMVRKKRISEVRALLIVEETAVLTDPRVAKLLDFYRTNRCFECRIILAETYDKLRRDSQIPSEYVDFGIYGTRLMFLTKDYGQLETIGLFVKDAERVAGYNRFFTKLWTSLSSQHNPSTASTRVSFAELLAFDKQQLSTRAEPL